MTLRIRKTIIIVSMITALFLLRYRSSPRSTLEESQRSQRTESPLNDAQNNDHHSIPTLLKILDPEICKGGRGETYLNALTNPLYEKIMSGKFYRESYDLVSHSKLYRNGNKIRIVGSTDQSMDATLLKRDPPSLDRNPFILWGTDNIPSLSWSKKRTGAPPSQFHSDRKRNEKQSIDTMWVDKDVVSFGSPLTLSWKKNALKNSDILTLHCPHDEPSPVEAATVDQVKHTATQRRRHEDPPGTTEEERPASSSSDDSTSQWRIESFPVVRQRSCAFRLWESTSEGGGDWYGLLAETDPFAIQNGTRAPTGIHLALTSDPLTQLFVHFNTGQRGTPLVSYTADGTANGSDDWYYKEGTSRTYNADDMCAAPANQTEIGKFADPGFMHAVPLSGLLYDKMYKYKVGIEVISDSTGHAGIVWSDEHTFVSPLPPPSQIESQNENDSQNFPLKFLVYGDQGCDESREDGGGYHTTTSLVQREIARHDNNIRAVHHIGDLSYAMGAAHVWDLWLDMIQPWSANVPLMVGIGNHEYDHLEGGEDGKDPSLVSSPGGFHPAWGNMGSDSGGECGVPAVMRFSPPTTSTRSTGENGVFWYSYDMGMVHVIMLSSEHDMQKGSPQRIWLEDHLPKVDRTSSPWLVVETHRPLYHAVFSWDGGNDAVALGMRHEIEDLLLDWKVDILFTGHYHAYWRSCAGLHKNVCGGGAVGSYAGMTHITVGTAGATLADGFLRAPDWMEAYLAEWGIGRVTVNGTHFLWEFIGGEEGSVLDSVVLSKLE